MLAVCICSNHEEVSTNIDPFVSACVRVYVCARICVYV